MTRKTTFSRGQCGGIVGISPPPPLVEIACGTSLPPHTLVPFANEEPILLVKGGKHDCTSRGGTRWRKNAKFIAPAVFAASDATARLQFGATRMTKLSINAKRRPRGGTGGGKVDTSVFPGSPPPCMSLVFLDPRERRKEITSWQILSRHQADYF